MKRRIKMPWEPSLKMRLRQRTAELVWDYWPLVKKSRLLKERAKDLRRFNRREDEHSAEMEKLTKGLREVQHLLTTGRVEREDFREHQLPPLPSAGSMKPDDLMGEISK